MIGALITLIIYLLVLGILIWLVYYVVDAIPLPDPLNRIVKIAVTVIAALVVIVLLLNLAGVGGLDLPKVGGNYEGIYHYAYFTAAPVLPGLV
jgi:hypothetical protein